MKAKTRAKVDRRGSFTPGIRRALRRAAKDARKTARMYRTPLYVWENGRVPKPLALPVISHTLFINACLYPLALIA